MLMVVGGTGIAAAVPYLRDHLQRSANSWSSTSEEKSRTQKIELVWTTRQSAFLCNLADRELNPMLSWEDFRASFYATASSDRSRQDPAGMADQARAATHLAMKQGYQELKYVEESFTW